MGSLHLCAGQPGGCEAATCIHAARSMFRSPGFSLLIQQTPLTVWTISCSYFLYANKHLQKWHGLVLWRDFLSAEGTIQDDKMAMTMYALAVTPLINKLCYHADQTRYTYDAAAAGSLSQFWQWWNALNKAGLLYGYLPKRKKRHKAGLLYGYLPKHKKRRILWSNLNSYKQRKRNLKALK